MNSEIKFQHLEHEDSNTVISFSNGTTFKIIKFMEYINRSFGNLVLNNLPEQLKQGGLGTPPSHQRWNTSVDAEILEPQSREWQKGKIRMRVILEFCPDEPEEVKNDNLSQNSDSLDDIRQTISQ
ncbi:KGK domain-containing protein [Pleurocapsa sp. PCC 7319]|uniref:KGK domain-containing protein n=1 Tax=Pleurocapsa sp. PCC 7319 TaxID=118161 RepID=UPI0003752BE0|nr:KGK domain-containing protein [Pleurocapsa sp. PCC 7319]